MNQARLSVRKIASPDIRFLLTYWRDASEEDLQRMGEFKRPDEKANLEFLNWFCESHPNIDEAKEDILIWEFDSKPIGYSTLKDVRVGNDAQIHLHMWEVKLRGKGLGSILFCLSASYFIKKFQLRKLYCQPKFDNPMPNQMLKKIGFNLVELVDELRTDGSTIKQLRYDICEQVINQYLHIDSQKKVKRTPTSEFLTAIVVALTEMIQRRKSQRIIELKGSMSSDYDYKAARKKR